MRDLFQQADAKKIELHWYQRDAIDLARQSFGKGKKRPCLALPTGAGKTYTAGAIANMALEKGNTVAFIVPFKALLAQTKASFERLNVPCGVFHHEFEGNLDAPVQIMTAQTMDSRLRKGRPIPDFDFGIYDEAHETKTLIKDMMLKGSKRWLGLTATPWTRGMGNIYDDLLIPVTIKQLIEEKYLCPFRAYAPNKPDLSGVQVMAGEYNQKQVGDVMADAHLVADVVSTWLKMGEDRPTLCFAVNKAHAERLSDDFNAAGVPSAFVVAETDQVERDWIGQRFAAGELKVVVNVRTLTTGVDWPVACVIDAAPTKSEALHVQKIGRGLRVNPPWEDCIILDHAGNSLSLGLVTDIHHDTLNTGQKGQGSSTERKKAEPRECSKCKIVKPAGQRICPNCGHEAKAPCKVEVEDGELVQIAGKKVAAKAPSMDDKQKFWSMALQVDADRGKGGKLAKALYKGKFGVWPKGVSNTPRQPDAAFLGYERSRRIAFAKKMEARHGAS